MSPRRLDPDAAAAGIRFVTQSLSPEEVAAATAVLAAALHEQALAAEARVTQLEPSAWSHSMRGLRRPLRGGWRGFTPEGL